MQAVLKMSGDVVDDIQDGIIRPFLRDWIAMANTVPIKDMKDTASFTKMIEEAEGPVTVTRNGYEAFVVMKPDDYEAMQQELAVARLEMRLAQAEREYAEGSYENGSSFLEGMKAKYDL